MNTAPSAPVLIAIPAYNAAPHLGAVIKGAQQSGLPVIVIDDGSSDESASVAERAGALVLRHHANRGKGAALQTAFAYARAHAAEAVLTLDADGQHDPHEIGPLLSAWGADPSRLVLGVRTFDPALMPRRSRIGNHISTFFISRFSGRPHRDTQTGFRVYPKRLFELPLGTRRFDTETELLLWAAKLGVPLVEVPIQTIYHSNALPSTTVGVGKAIAAAPSTHFRNWEDTLRVIRLVVSSPFWRTPTADKMEAN